MRPRASSTRLRRRTKRMWTRRRRPRQPDLVSLRGINYVVLAQEHASSKTIVERAAVPKAGGSTFAVAPLGLSKIHGADDLFSMVPAVGPDASDPFSRRAFLQAADTLARGKPLSVLLYREGSCLLEEAVHYLLGAAPALTSAGASATVARLSQMISALPTMTARALGRFPADPLVTHEALLGQLGALLERMRATVERTPSLAGVDFGALGLQARLTRSLSTRVFELPRRGCGFPAEDNAALAVLATRSPPPSQAAGSG